MLLSTKGSSLVRGSWGLSRSGSGSGCLESVSAAKGTVSLGFVSSRSRSETP